MTAMIDIAALDDIPRQGARVVKTEAGCVAVFRTADDRILHWRTAVRIRAGL